MKIRLQSFDDSPTNREHAQLGLPPVANDTPAPLPLPVGGRAATSPAASSAAAWRLWALGFLLLGASALFIAQHGGAQSSLSGLGWLRTLVSTPEFWLAVGVGFAAQAIDGALGMAYGISSTTFLIGMGASPAAASGAVHVAEVFTTGFSGAAHLRFGNVDRRLFYRLALPGVAGGVAGAYFLTHIDGQLLKPFIATYLLIMGLHILRKAWRHASGSRRGEIRHVGALAVTGGFADAVGGGGWGPIVTSTLLGRGLDPRRAIGTVNTAEFFIALATGGAFLLFGTLEHWALIAGLALGGLFAAPMAAWLTRKLPARHLLWLVGALISSLSLFNLVVALR
jgi:uncharacterized membrane protein YfcA